MRRKAGWINKLKQEAPQIETPSSMQKSLRTTSQT